MFFAFYKDYDWKVMMWGDYFKISGVSLCSIYLSIIQDYTIISSIKIKSKVKELRSKPSMWYFYGSSQSYWSHYKVAFFVRYFQISFFVHGDKFFTDQLTSRSTWPPFPQNRSVRCFFRRAVHGALLILIHECTVPMS